MKRKLSNKAKLNMSNAQHCRLYSVHKDLSCENLSSNYDKYLSSTIKMNYHKQVCEEQRKKGRFLSSREKKQIFSGVKSFVEQLL